MRYFYAICFLLTSISLIAQTNTSSYPQKIENDLKKRNLKGKVKTLTEYYYDVGVNPKSEPSKSSLKRISTFNQFGMVEKEEFFEGSKLDSLVSLRKYIYDDKGLLIKTIGKDGKVKKVNDVRFESNKNKINVYDKNNNLILEEHYDSSGIKTGRTAFKYDSKGNLLVRIDSNLKFIGGLPKEKIGTDISSMTFKYEMFDKKGNWKVQYLVRNNKPKLKMKREITYY